MTTTTTTTPRWCACGCGASFGRHESLRQTLDEVEFDASTSGRASAGDVDGLVRALEREAKRGGVGKGRVGHTALHYAARGGSEACVEACLRYGYGDDGVLDARTKGGATALHKGVRWRARVVREGAASGGGERGGARRRRRDASAQGVRQSRRRVRASGLRGGSGRGACFRCAWSDAARCGAGIGAGDVEGDSAGRVTDARWRTVVAFSLDCNSV